ncbi:hypothetical protein HAX54_006140, partial [Datura stramonium]|nr:hypothetical protein [Datura stramonium]
KRVILHHTSVSPVLTRGAPVKRRSEAVPKALFLNQRFIRCSIGPDRWFAGELHS